MVIKKDLQQWFSSLDACKRIEYMCDLLLMCTPLELRFIGSVVEDLAKKDFHYLRDSEIKANQAVDVSNFTKTGSLADQQIRSKISVTLALLSSTNSSRAETIFDLLKCQFENLLGRSILNNKSAADEILLILTLAVHHPAFKFAQRRQLEEELIKVQDRTQELFKEEDRLNLNLPSQANEKDSSHHSASFLSRQYPASPEPDRVTIKAIEVKDAKQESQHRKGGAEYQIHTTWSNGDVTEVYMKFKQLQEMHHKLLNKFPEERKQHKTIPVFPGKQAHQHEPLDSKISSINLYLSHLVKAPANILDCETLTEPLRNGTLVGQQLTPASTPNSPSNMAAIPTAQPHEVFMRASPESGAAVFDYGSVAAPGSRRLPNAHGSPNSTVTNSQGSPGPSQRSSVTNSPANSRTSSPAPPVPQAGGKTNLSHPANKGKISQVNGYSIELSLDQLLRLLDLEKYSDNLRDFSFKQITIMTKEDFAKAGLPPEALSKLRSSLDQLKQTSQDRQDQNGLIEAQHPSVESIQPVPFWSFPRPPCIPYQPIIRHPFQAAHFALHPSPHPLIPQGDHSPANSEASSPSPSPLMHPMGGLPPESIQGHQVIQGIPVTAPPLSMMSPPAAVAADSLAPADVKLFKNSKSQQFDSSGSEEDKGTGYNQEPAPSQVKGRGRPQQSQSLPIINQSAALVSAADETKASAMSNSLSAPHNHPALNSAEPRTNNTPPLPNLSVSASPHLPTNGYISDPPPHQSQGPPNALSRTLPNRQHTKPPLMMQKSVPMPLPMQPQNLGKNGGGPILHTGPPHHSIYVPQAAPSASSAHLMAMPHANLQTNSNALHVIPQQHPQVPPPSLEGGTPLFSSFMYPHAILTTVANSTAIMTTTQSHPSGPPLSHSPSPVGTGDQVQTAPCIVSAESMDPSRPEGRSLTPPSHTHFNAVKSQSNASGPNSGTPSPPLVSAGRNPTVMIPYFYQMYHPPGHQPQQQPFPNGLTPDHYLAGRYPPQLNPNHIAYMYGNSMCPPHNQAIPTATIPNTTVSVQTQSSGKVVSCFNCGQHGHKAPECKENTMENMSNTFRLNFKKPDSE